MQTTDEQLPAEQKELILRAVLALLPRPGASAAVAKASQEARILSEELQSGKAVTNQQINESLARIYEAYSQHLIVASQNTKNPTDEIILALIAKGYRMLSEATAAQDWAKLAEALDFIQTSVEGP